MPQELPLPQSESLNAIVSAAVEAAKGNRTDAVKDVLKTLAVDEHLYSSIAEQLVTVAVKTLVSGCYIQNRKTAFTPPDQSATIKVYAHAVKHSLLDGWYLENNGKVLGDSNKMEVAAEAELYQARARTNQSRAALLNLIVASMGKHKVVRNAMDETKLRAMQVEAGA